MNLTEDSPNLLSNNVFDMDLFFRLSPDMICIAGYDGYFKRVNPAVLKTLEYTEDELFSKPIDEFIYHDDRDITSKNRENLKRSIPLLNFENRYVTKSGALVWLSWTSIPVEDQQVVFAIAKNITHKKKIEEDRRLLLANLTQTNNELKQLAYTTAHDLRSPVNSLIAAFNIMDVSRIDSDELTEYLDILKSSTENLRHTLDDYVDALIQKNSLNIQAGPVSLSESFNTVLTSLKSLIVDSGTKIKADFSNIDTVNFNKGYLESIYLNLISNSIKYAKPNTYPEISVSSRLKKGMVIVLFKDKGLGFDMDKVKDRVFGFNQTFHDNDDSKGIGLYLVYNHLTSLGGHIEVESKVNKGTIFTMLFKA